MRKSSREEGYPAGCLVILEEVCLLYGVEQEELFAQDRHKTMVEARSVAAYLIRKLERLSFPEIGRFLDRDHSTIINSIKRIEKCDDEVTLTRLESVLNRVKMRRGAA